MTVGAGKESAVAAGDEYASDVNFMAAPWYLRPT